MAFQDLSSLELLEGILGLIWVCCAIFIGIRIILKASALDRKDLIAVGSSYIFVSSAWWGVVFQFIFFGFFSIYISEYFYLMIANAFLPIGLIFWVYSFTEMVNPDWRKLFLGVYIPICILWEILLFSLLNINIVLIGNLDGIFNSTHGPVLRIFTIIATLTFVLTGGYFSIKSMRLDDPEIKWKGRFLLVAWISFGIGALLDSSLPSELFFIIIIRILLITGAIEYYFGFFLPEKFKRILIS